jgi:hypothetical protein
LNANEATEQRLEAAEGEAAQLRIQLAALEKKDHSSNNGGKRKKKK